MPLEAGLSVTRLPEPGYGSSFANLTNLPEITVEVEGRDLVEVVAMIAAQARVEIFVVPDIHETVTISLRRIGWRDALAVIAKMARCEVEESGFGFRLSQD